MASSEASDDDLEIIKTVRKDLNGGGKSNDGILIASVHVAYPVNPLSLNVFKLTLTKKFVNRIAS